MVEMKAWKWGYFVWLHFEEVRNLKVSTMSIKIVLSSKNVYSLVKIKTVGSIKYQIKFHNKIRIINNNNNNNNNDHPLG